MWAQFVKNDDYVLVVLSEEGGDTGSWAEYKVTSDAQIERFPRCNDY
jgi:hypothetical protein